jgi:hypothetical protein
VTITIDSAWRVRASGTVDVPVSATAAWGQMRDVLGFLAIDPLHVKVEATSQPDEAGSPRGMQLVLRHRLAGIGPDRVGRVLTWREGEGYAVSDLSRRGVRVGFPHVCIYRVEPRVAGGSRVTIAARGVWTARWMPRWLVRAWLWWAITATEARLAGHFARLCR